MGIRKYFKNLYISLTMYLYIYIYWRAIFFKSLYEQKQISGKSSAGLFTLLSWLIAIRLSRSNPGLCYLIIVFCKVHEQLQFIIIIQGTRCNTASVNSQKASILFSCLSVLHILCIYKLNMSSNKNFYRYFMTTETLQTNTTTYIYRYMYLHIYISDYKVTP